MERAKYSASVVDSAIVVCNLDCQMMDNLHKRLRSQLGKDKLKDRVLDQVPNRQQNLRRHSIRKQGYSIVDRFSGNLRSVRQPDPNPCTQYSVLYCSASQREGNLCRFGLRKECVTDHWLKHGWRPHPHDTSPSKKERISRSVVGGSWHRQQDHKTQYGATQVRQSESYTLPTIT